ncbi:MAG: ferritin-like domain-containing protein [Bdellovibrionota bacterium]|jgi:ferritin-like metal-binding protein YciE
MGIFSTLNFEHLEDLFLQQLKSLYEGEQRMTTILRKMSEKASSDELAKAFTAHLSETKGQVARLEKAFQLLGKKPERTTCEAIKGLIEDCEEVLEAKGSHDVIDAALIAADQRVEHFEIAGYGTARNYAQRLGHQEVAMLLEESLKEEKEADANLTAIAISSVNVAAQAA